MDRVVKRIGESMNKQKNNRRKIAVSVLGWNISENNGINVRAKNIAELIREEYDVTLIGRGNKGQKLNDAIVIAPVKTKLWNFKLIPIILQNKFNYIYCVGDLFGFLTYYLFSKIYRYGVIFDATGVYSNLATSPNILGSKTYRILERFIVKHADHVIAISRYVFDFYEKYNNNISLLTSFVDEDMFKKKESGIKDKTKKRSRLLGMIGPFVSSSNLHYLSLLKANLDKFDGRINFVLIGRCDYRIDSERIRYSGYLNSTEDYVAQLSSLDAVLLPHKPLDPGPYTKIIECMSCGLPVFTTPKGIVGLDYVTPGKDILVYEDEKLIGKVNEEIFNDTLMKKIGRNARITVEKYYSRKAKRKQLLHILRSLEDRIF